MTHRHPMDNEKGQSTMEFIVGFIFVLTFLFTFYKLALGYTNGYLVHYATFMASRAYLVLDDNNDNIASSDNFAESEAIKVFKNTFSWQYSNFDWTKFLDSIPDLQVRGPNSDPDNFFTGVWTEFKQKISIANYFGGNKEVTLRSESFLGREPTRKTCIERICHEFQSVMGGINCRDPHITVSDNGC